MCTCTPTSHAFSSFCVITYYYHMLFLSFTTIFIISILNLVQYSKTMVMGYSSSNLFINFSLNAINCPCCYNLVVWCKNIYVASKLKPCHHLCCIGTGTMSIQYEYRYENTTILEREMLYPTKANPWITRITLPLLCFSPNTPSGLIYKKHLTFLIYFINDVFGLYFRQDTSITQWI
jgi:hypothetical protein